MNVDILIEALELPARCRVDQRVPKKMLLENGAPTAADKRLLNDGIDELIWVAALKPTTIGVAEVRDGVRDYVEIAVLRATLRASAKVKRVAKLVHRAVPYPLLLLTEHRGQAGISVVHKRWSQADAGKTVLDGDVIAVEWDAASDGKHGPAFLRALALGNQPSSTLHTLYQGWLDTLEALHAARRTDRFIMASDAAHAAVRREALKESVRLVAVIKRLRVRAAREKQMSRCVELNLEIKRLEAALAAASAQL